MSLLRRKPQRFSNLEVYSVSTRGSATVVHCTRLRKLRCACSNASIATEADELEEVPGEEKEELSLIYQAKGLPEDLANRWPNN